MTIRKFTSILNCGNKSRYLTPEERKKNALPRIAGVAAQCPRTISKLPAIPVCITLAGHENPKRNLPVQFTLPVLKFIITMATTSLA